MEKPTLRCYVISKLVVKATKLMFLEIIEEIWASLFRMRELSFKCSIKNMEV